MELRNLPQLVNNMKRYLKIYRAIIKINIAYILTYRANFINGTIISFLWGAFNVVWVTLITNKATLVFGWKGGELVIITISYIVLTGINYTFFAHNFENFSRIVDRAEFDSILLKPIDPQFYISTIKISFGSFIRTITGSIFLAWWVVSHHYLTGPIQIMCYIVLLAVGVIMMYAIWFLFITTLIWYPNLGNLTEFLFTLNGFSRYPPEMLLSRGLTALLIFIPISLIVATPVKVLLQKNAWGDIGLMVGLCTILFYASRKFWKYALKHYTSAS